MKRCIILCCINFLWQTAFCQADYSGNYGFQSKIYVDKSSTLKPSKDEQGHLGALTLLKIDNDKYKFWLSANRGWPSYNNGEINGILIFKNKVAVFTKKLEYSDSSCKINFYFNPGFVQVDQKANDIDCGFGHNVFADGKYKKKDAHKINNAELRDLYIDVSFYKVITAKAFLSVDEAGINQKQQYFIKGDKILCTEENDSFIYVESISPSGKFVYGWLKKVDVVLVKK